MEEQVHSYAPPRSLLERGIRWFLIEVLRFLKVVAQTPAVVVFFALFMVGFILIQESPDGTGAAALQPLVRGLFRFLGMEGHYSGLDVVLLASRAFYWVVLPFYLLSVLLRPWTGKLRFSFAQKATAMAVFSVLMIVSLSILFVNAKTAPGTTYGHLVLFVSVMTAIGYLLSLMFFALSGFFDWLIDLLA